MGCGCFGFGAGLIFIWSCNSFLILIITRCLFLCCFGFWIGLGFWFLVVVLGFLSFGVVIEFFGGVVLSVWWFVGVVILVI